MKKKRIIVGCILSIVLFLALLMAYFFKEYNRYSNIINSNWNIKLSKSYKEIYSTDSGPSFHGDGERYHIFEYKNSDYLNSALPWKNEKNLVLEEEIKSIIQKLNISKVYSPNFEQDYKYYSKTQEDSSKIYLLFYPNLNRFYIIERLQ